ncbi:Maltose O-acetyltransferase [Stieleria neptunia]|uniref:Maltose O-acetyltransferase n=1 Tax=Stieleria neptunia TaxID=2527979 RepID=A0A518HQP1_9BACT|nr:putative colanic acid biosynthesis acetyltransferase [Stieleria neptunia]QDV43160.1 Maltose O-acetyltransferase [Stieleria neptunia]
MNQVKHVDVIAENRKSRKWSTRELLGRLLWSFLSPLFRYSPRLLWGWRRFLLRLFGATIGQQVHIDPSAKIFIPWNLRIGDWSSVGFDCLLYNLGPLVIGDRVTLSQRSHLCGGSHDYSDPTMPLIKASITVGSGAWICADAFVGPGVTVGDGAVVGARACVTKDVSPWKVVAGNPAREVGQRVMDSQ